MVSTRSSISVDVDVDVEEDWSLYCPQVILCVQDEVFKGSHCEGQANNRSPINRKSRRLTGNNLVIDDVEMAGPSSIESTVNHKASPNKQKEGHHRVSNRAVSGGAQQNPWVDTKLMQTAIVNLERVSSKACSTSPNISVIVLNPEGGPVGSNRKCITSPLRSADSVAVIELDSDGETPSKGSSPVTPVLAPDNPSAIPANARAVVELDCDGDVRSKGSVPMTPVLAPDNPSSIPANARAVVELDSDEDVRSKGLSPVTPVLAPDNPSSIPANGGAVVELDSDDDARSKGSSEAADQPRVPVVKRHYLDQFNVDYFRKLGMEWKPDLNALRKEVEETKAVHGNENSHQKELITGRARKQTGTSTKNKAASSIPNRILEHDDVCRPATRASPSKGVANVSPIKNAVVNTMSVGTSKVLRASKRSLDAHAFITDNRALRARAIRPLKTTWPTRVSDVNSAMGNLQLTTLSTKVVSSNSPPSRINDRVPNINLNQVSGGLVHSTGTASSKKLSPRKCKKNIPEVEQCSPGLQRKMSELGVNDTSPCIVQPRYPARSRSSPKESAGASSEQQKTLTELNISVGIPREAGAMSRLPKCPKTPIVAIDTTEVENNLCKKSLNRNVDTLSTDIVGHEIRSSRTAKLETEERRATNKVSFRTRREKNDNTAGKQKDQEIEVVGSFVRTSRKVNPEMDVVKIDQGSAMMPNKELKVVLTRVSKRVDGGGKTLADVTSMLTTKNYVSVPLLSRIFVEPPSTSESGSLGRQKLSKTLNNINEVEIVEEVKQVRKPAAHDDNSRPLLCRIFTEPLRTISNPTASLGQSVRIESGSGSTGKRKLKKESSTKESEVEIVQVVKPIRELVTRNDSNRPLPTITKTILNTGQSVGIESTDASVAKETVRMISTNTDKLGTLREVEKSRKILASNRLANVILPSNKIRSPQLTQSNASPNKLTHTVSSIAREAFGRGNTRLNVATKVYDIRNVDIPRSDNTSASSKLSLRGMEDDDNGAASSRPVVSTEDDDVLVMKIASSELSIHSDFSTGRKKLERKTGQTSLRRMSMSPPHETHLTIQHAIPAIRGVSDNDSSSGTSYTSDNNMFTGTRRNVFRHYKSSDSDRCSIDKFIKAANAANPSKQSSSDKQGGIMLGKNKAESRRNPFDGASFNCSSHNHHSPYKPKWPTFTKDDDSVQPSSSVGNCNKPALRRSLSWSDNPKLELPRTTLKTHDKASQTGQHSRNGNWQTSERSSDDTIDVANARKCSRTRNLDHRQSITGFSVHDLLEDMESDERAVTESLDREMYERNRDVTRIRHSKVKIRLHGGLIRSGTKVKTALRSMPKLGIDRNDRDTDIWSCSDGGVDNNPKKSRRSKRSLKRVDPPLQEVTVVEDKGKHKTKRNVSATRCENLGDKGADGSMSEVGCPEDSSKELGLKKRRVPECSESANDIFEVSSDDENDFFIAKSTKRKSVNPGSSVASKTKKQASRYGGNLNVSRRQGTLDRPTREENKPKSLIDHIRDVDHSEKSDLNKVKGKSSSRRLETAESMSSGRRGKRGRKSSVIPLPSMTDEDSRESAGSSNIFGPRSSEARKQVSTKSPTRGSDPVELFAKVTKKWSPSSRKPFRGFNPTNRPDRPADKGVVDDRTASHPGKRLSIRRTPRRKDAAVPSGVFSKDSKPMQDARRKIARKVGDGNLKKDVGGILRENELDFKVVSDSDS